MKLVYCTFTGALSKIKPNIYLQFVTKDYLVHRRQIYKTVIQPIEPIAAQNHY